MSVKELQALTQKFADAFDQRDLQPVMEMLSEDVEVFDLVPYRFDGKPLFAKYLHEAVAGLVSASFGFCYALGALRIRRDHPAGLEMERDYQ
jgi:ketosteroid isomerase-like protein